MNKRKYRVWTDRELATAVKESKSIAEVLRKLNLQVAGGNYHSIKTNISRLNLDISHFVGQAWNKDTYHNIGDLKKPSAIKRNLIKLRGHRCEECQLTEWLALAIKLELHHIDGNRNNNQDANLQLLCPNCHAYTDNYRGKNIGR